MLSFFKTLIGKKPKNIETLQDIFTCNLKYLPDTSFERVKGGRIVGGRHYSVYAKRLRKRECRLFNIVEVRTPREFENKTITFICDDIKAVNPHSLPQFINNCYKLFGLDAWADRGRFDAMDKEEIDDGNWRGRFWNSNKDKVKVSISLKGKQIEVDVKM